MVTFNLNSPANLAVRSDTAIAPPEIEAYEIPIELPKEIQAIADAYANGKVLNQLELRTWAKAEIGDVVRKYRRSGWILNPSPSDTNRNFLQFLQSQGRTINGRNGEPPSATYAAAYLRKLEQDPGNWLALTLAVETWALDPDGSKGVTRSPATAIEQSRRYQRFLSSVE